MVNACVNSSLTYGCEAWGSCPLNTVEILQRKALKMILDVSRNTSNEMIYIESGRLPLKPMIYKRQLKYYYKMKNDCMNNPTSLISMTFAQALSCNTTFVKHYKELDEKFSTPDECYRFYVNLHERQARIKLQEKSDLDMDSTLGTYMRINPTLQSPVFYQDISCHEGDRTIITRYRVGSHKLRIQNGRLGGIDRRDRLCRCNNDIQTIEHVLFNCPLTEFNGIRNLNLETFFSRNEYVNIAEVLKAIDKIVN